MLPSVSDEAATEAFLPVVTDEDIREVQARQDPPAERPPARTLLGAPVVSAADLARTAAPAEPPAETAHPSPPPEAASPGTPHPAPTNPAAAGPALEQPRPPSTLLPPLEDLRALVPQPARGLFGSIAYARRAGPARRRLSGVLRALDAPGADQVYGAEVARLAATIDDRTIRRGRLLLVILVTTPIVLALLAWLVFGVLLSDDAVGSKAESAPDAARNTGPSSATLARALPPGYHAYVGLSLEGTRSAEVLAGLTPLIERLPTLDRLRAADIPAQEVDVLLFALGPDGLLEVAGTAHAAAAARARLGDSAHVHDDGTVVIGPTEEQVAAVAERLAAESSEGFATGDLADLAEYVDQNGTLWLMADRTGLEPLRRQGRNGEVPREARRLIRRATGLALTVHAANALHVSAAVRFDDAEAAAAALEVVEALIAEHRQALEATPDGTEQAAAAARAILGTAQVSTDGRYLRVVLTVTAEQAAPLRELST